jgi:hypothetical protein
LWQFTHWNNYSTGFTRWMLLEEICEDAGIYAVLAAAGRRPYNAEPVFHSNARTAPNADPPSARDA